jgi:hypothetical protein
MGGIFLLNSISLKILAQTTSGNTIATNGQNSSTITTAAPFLLIAPDSRGASMGDNGVASAPDVNSMHWNPAKYAFAPDGGGLGISYTPWLRKLVSDINLAYVSAYTRLDQRQTLAASFRYFSYGDIIYTDQLGNNYGLFKPSEFSFDAAYARKLSNNFSMALAGRFIHSNIGQSTQSSNLKPANGVAADIAIYWNKEVNLLGSSATAAYGVNISNIGTKIDYGSSTKDFLPTNLRIGGSTNFHLDENNSVAFSLDLNKLLVPTNPIRDLNGNIISGKDPNVSVPAGIFQSFTDAPGGVKQELQEISYSVGMEYNYSQQLYLRTGYFYENPNQGNRRYLELGAGVKYNVFNIDFAYLLSDNTNPLSNTLRFSLNFYFGDKKLSDSGSRDSFQ